jgi:hypothetical protein
MSCCWIYHNPASLGLGVTQNRERAQPPPVMWLFLFMPKWPRPGIPAAMWPTAKAVEDEQSRQR